MSDHVVIQLPLFLGKAVSKMSRDGIVDEDGTTIVTGLLLTALILGSELDDEEVALYRSQLGKMNPSMVNL